MNIRDTSNAVRPEVFNQGTKNRQEVLGEDYVAGAWARAEEDPFLRPLQEAVTGLAWGAIWGRPGLDRKTRSFITVSMLLALNRRHELALHLRGALNNGCTPEELQELLIHAGCYCGWPAAIEGFRVAKEVLDEVAAAAAQGGAAATPPG